MSIGEQEKRPICKQKPPGWTTGGFGTHKDVEFIGLPKPSEFGGMGHRSAEREEEACSNHCSVELRRHAGHRRVPQSWAAARVSMR